ncbi:MAG: VWA domain-containing protein [Pyrinomonadaceae bacterium]|nr:VWA domain-containing protein [Pyrinomonadaceae bacterium]
MVFFFLAGFTFAQDPDDDITVDSSVVRLNVGVVNSTGRPITNLSRSNFKIFEDGIAQDISHFEPTSAPFSVVLILDMSGSTLGFRQNIKFSASRFIDALSPDDRVSVLEFYNRVNVLNGFTTDRSKIYHSIKVSNGKKGETKTQLFRAIDLALDKLATEGSRRKAIIVLTDGADTAARDMDRNQLNKLEDSEMTGAVNPEENPLLKSALDKASKYSVTIYPLALPTNDPRKFIDPLPIQLAMYDLARERLNILATRTGGEMHKINRLEEMGVLYARVAANVRSLYTIEYQPKNVKKDGKWREIKLKLNMPDLVYTTRPGYFAQ